MATIKSFTSLEQSKKLAEILPLESADMYYWCADHYPKEDWIIEVGTPDDNYEWICAWSLAALLGVLEHPRCFQGDKPTYWFCGCFGKDKLYHEVEADNPVDACVKMIIKLNELNLL